MDKAVTAGREITESPPTESDAGIHVPKRPPPLPILDSAEGLPGMRVYEGRPSYGIDDIREALKLIDAANIPACIVGVYALRYYGADRLTWEWDVCVPTSQLKEAESVFIQHDQYETTKPPPPLMKSFRHLNPIYKLKGAGFFFILTPSTQCFIDPRPEHCELSKNGIPYPKMTQFARSLLVLQNLCDLDDFVDGMDLDEKWGEENIDFDELQVTGMKFTEAQNLELIARDLGQYNDKVNYRRRWNETVNTKERRIEPMKKGRYKTRWRRIKNDIDPRLRDKAI